MQNVGHPTLIQVGLVFKQFLDRETAMSISGDVLIYGRDLRLLETRSWILQKAGYKVSAAMELSDVKRILGSEKVNLSILCHTLSSEQRSRAVAKIEELRPHVKKLLLAASSFAPVEGNPEEMFYTSAGPSALIAAVNLLMNGDGKTSNTATSFH
jgi:hypothetical protein